jgi:hypothetical protein
MALFSGDRVDEDFLVLAWLLRNGKPFRYGKGPHWERGNPARPEDSQAGLLPPKIAYFPP